MADLFITGLGRRARLPNPGNTTLAIGEEAASPKPGKRFNSGNTTLAVGEEAASPKPPGKRFSNPGR